MTFGRLIDHGANPQSETKPMWNAQNSRTRIVNEVEAGSAPKRRFRLQGATEDATGLNPKLSADKTRLEVELAERRMR